MAEAMTCQCLCGACTFEATPKAMEMGSCHCGMCRKWSGGVFMSVDCGSSVRFADDAPIGRYRASEWGERVFCIQCGSSLAWQTQDGQYQYVALQSFEDPSAFKFGLQVFIDKKPDTYEFANKTGTMTEAEVFAMFAPPPEEHA